MQIILNPSPINEKINEIDFGKLTYIVLNEIEAKEISGSKTAEESLLFFSKNYPDLKIMLTLGEKGSVYSDNENNISQAAFLVDAVDTTGAGDTFTGYFVAGISQNENYGEILKKASAASAISVSIMGAAPSIPKIDEVKKFIAK
jgi:ribokinase